MPETNAYSLVDSGNGRKLERFGPYLLSRPCSQAVWKPQLPNSEWNQADAIFSREPTSSWRQRERLPDHWCLETADLTFKIAPTDFGHLGLFPEQRPFWDWIRQRLLANPASHPAPRVLNLFAYSGGATLAAASAGASVCHLDASKGMVTWARENAALNQLERAPIRWIVEDVKKFLKRERQRNSRYEGIILDPPSFGRGAKGEVFKIEEEIVPLLDDCRQLLSDHPLFLLFSCHTPGFSPLVMHHLLQQALEGVDGTLEKGEMALTDPTTPHIFAVPSGAYASWEATL